MKVGNRPATPPARTRFVPTGNYTGAELSSAPARPGAMAAFSVPSRVGNRQMTPQQMRAERMAPVVQAPPAPAPAPAAPRPATVQAAPTTSARPSNGRPYSPRIGSAVDLVLHHLHQKGGHLTRGDICTLFNVSRNCISASFASAIEAGALVKVCIGNERGFALPGYEPPASQPAYQPEAVAFRRAASRPPQDARALLAEVAGTFRSLAAALDLLGHALPSLSQPVGE